MTQLEKQEIIKLKNEGRSYKQISDLTGICVSTIKSLCTRYQTKQNELVYYCKCCGKKLVFTNGKKQKQYCSDTCRMRYWRNNKDKMNIAHTIQVECPVCHRVFTDYETKKRKYCCWSCYMEAKQRTVTGYGK